MLFDENVQLQELLILEPDNISNKYPADDSFDALSHNNTQDYHG